MHPGKHVRESLASYIRLPGGSRLIRFVSFAAVEDIERGTNSTIHDDSQLLRLHWVQADEARQA
ncbi:hypothetical protein IVB33_38730 [Bradyrhizobium sp. 24]|nr:hypothetical protein [Bradyrhizobium sp. 24]